MLILNFHGLGRMERRLDDGENLCCIEVGFFEAILDLVRANSHVELTFDDGNISDAKIALPALSRRGLRATFFICSGRLDQPHFLTPSHVRELQRQGMSIGSHGVAHLPWRHLSENRLSAELEESRRTLQRLSDSQIDAVACPFGAYDSKVLKTIRRSGYRYAYTSDGGYCSANYWLRSRNTISRTMDLADVKHLIYRKPGFWQHVSTGARRLAKRLR